MHNEPIVNLVSVVAGGRSHKKTLSTVVCVGGGVSIGGERAGIRIVFFNSFSCYMRNLKLLTAISIHGRLVRSADRG